MIRLAVLLTILFLTMNTAIAQEDETPRVSAPPGESSTRNLTPRLRSRSVVMDIDARILENEQITWNETHQKITIPGRPVEIKLIGGNVVVVVRFTFIQNHGNRQKLLVAQGQVWTADPGQGIRYQASVQTIPLEFDETICYFPLGSLKPGEGASSIEVMLTVNPYEDNN
jgi:hypothetical protein